jgi:hypothetical protein
MKQVEQLINHQGQKSFVVPQSIPSIDREIIQSLLILHWYFIKAQKVSD